ncbi:hypothetical protein SynROS8604_01283 [Synechococcus sp. ROS8604]|nr:hypothetical protein SynROS8604_01283 [Synechococcus sp. ROS8604]
MIYGVNAFQRLDGSWQKVVGRRHAAQVLKLSLHKFTRQANF